MDDRESERKGALESTTVLARAASATPRDDFGFVFFLCTFPLVLMVGSFWGIFGVLGVVVAMCLAWRGCVCLRTLFACSPMNIWHPKNQAYIIWLLLIVWGVGGLAVLGLIEQQDRGMAGALGMMWGICLMMPLIVLGLPASIILFVVGAVADGRMRREQHALKSRDTNDPPAPLGGQESQKQRKRPISMYPERGSHTLITFRRLRAHNAWWKRETERLSQPGVLVATLIGFVLVALLFVTLVLR